MVKASPNNNNKPKAAAAAKKKKNNNNNAPPRSSSTTTTRKNGIAGGPQRILDFVFFMENKLNTTDIPRHQVMAASSVKPITFPVTLSGMKKRGLIEYTKDTVRLTPEGRSQANRLASAATTTAGTTDREQHHHGGRTMMTMASTTAQYNHINSNITSNESAQDDIIKRYKIGGKALVVYNTLRDGRVHDRLTVMTQAGIPKNTFAVMLSGLKMKQILFVDKTSLQLTDMSFPFGRPR
jgi:hypothetical protein